MSVHHPRVQVLVFARSALPSRLRRTEARVSSAARYQRHRLNPEPLFQGLTQFVIDFR